MSQSVSEDPAPRLAPIRSIYPFRQYRFATPDGDINYVDEGDGPVVVMIHGNPTWSFYYRRLIATLMPHFRVIVPDHLGCGLSDKPQNYSYRLENHIENLSLLLRELGIDEADLVLHDWGGPIGMGYAVRREIQVRRFVIFNTTAWLSPHFPKSILACKTPVLGNLFMRGLNGFAVGATHLAVERPLDPLVRQGYLLPYNSYRNRIAIHRFVQDIPMHPSHPTWSVADAVDRQLGQFRDTPMLIMWGGKDWCFSDHFLSGWLERFPQADVRRIDDAGHYVLEDAHEYIVPQVVQFLRR